MDLISAIHGFRRWGFFDKLELLQISITSLIFGFIFAFSSWSWPDSPAVFSAKAGLYYSLVYALISFLALSATFLMSRIMAIKMGFIPKYRMWGMGLIISGTIALLTNGFPIYLASGGNVLRRHEGLELNYFFKGMSYQKTSFLAFWGIFGLMLYSGILTLIPDSILSPETKIKMIFCNVMIGIGTLIPIDAIVAIWVRDIPNSFGTVLLFGRFAFAFFNVIFFAICSLSLFFFGIWALPISLIIGGMGYIAFRLFAPINGKYPLWK